LRRKPTRPEVVAVTGAASGLGRALVERLADRTDLDALLGVDTVPARVDGVVWRAVDLRDPGLATRLRGVTTLVHLAPPPDPTTPVTVRRALSIEAAGAVLGAAHELKARAILCTSADVYGARPDHPVPLTDATALCEPDD